MSIYKCGSRFPDLLYDNFVAETADVIGNVILRRGATVWYQAVIRGDSELIEVGEGSNIQDGAVLHADPGFPLKIGDGVTVGHQAMLHGCTVGDGSLIGIRAVVLNGAVIGKNCLVAAGAVITEGKEFPDNSLIVGAPAKVIRELPADAVDNMHKNALHYVANGKCHKEDVIKVG